MSQSDYIKYKRLANELKNQAENLDPVIDSGKYIGYKSFTLENTILNTKLSYAKLQPANSVNECMDRCKDNLPKCTGGTFSNYENYNILTLILSACRCVFVYNP